MDAYAGHKLNCGAVATGPCPLRCRPSMGDGQRCSLQSVGHKRTCQRGEYLFHEGDTCDAAYSLLSGLIALERVDDDGEIAILRMVRPGQTISFSELFEAAEHTTSARALQNSVLCPLPRNSLVSALDSDRSFAMRLLRWTSEETREMERSAFRSVSMGIEERILDLLQDFSEGRDSFQLPVAKKDIARMAGTSPEVFSRTLARLHQNGRITLADTRIALLPQVA